MPDSRTLIASELALQREADEVAADLDLWDLLGALGDPVRVGSAALGLMVHRDLDVTVVCAKLHVAPVAEVGAQLARHARVRSVLFRNDTGQWNTDPTYPDGLYLGLRYRSDAGDWTIDIWFVDNPLRQPDLQHLDTLLPRLDETKRTTILRIKTEWVSKPEYGPTVSGFDIYSAVLDAGVTDLEGFERWLLQG